jgi:hypothetical protein
MRFRWASFSAWFTSTGKAVQVVVVRVSDGIGFEGSGVSTMSSGNPSNFTWRIKLVAANDTLASGVETDLRFSLLDGIDFVLALGCQLLQTGRY